MAGKWRHEDLANRCVECPFCLIFTTFQGQFGDILPLNGSSVVPGVEFGAPPRWGLWEGWSPKQEGPCEVQIEAHVRGGRKPPGGPEGAGIRVFDGPTVSLFQREC